ncbi:hypothetical protein [Streptomyces sp. NBC_01334]|uniref:hypothetical protein n=1 Tax=Streptomyces sp. NBC_01334 TaxID=2903827 RepID=UPI002E158FDA|nr:hypothetical protein OG736_13405 [Streptomyces sp. NBC_01334]
MTSGGRLEKLARTRQLYTGEPFSVAKNAMCGRDNRHPIHTGPLSQAHLEAEVFAKLCGGGQWWAHPLGLSHMQSTTKSAVVHLDSHTTFGSGIPYPRSGHALDKLLPSADPGVQVNGVVGLRVVGIDGTDLHLTLTDSECHLVLRGIPGTDWAEELDERWRRYEKAEAPPLWQQPKLTTFEDAHIRDYPETWTDERGLDWLGSALLRRIAIFQTSSTAYSTRSWITGEKWIFELDTVRGIRLEHDVFLRRLMDPVWGLPLSIEHQHCSCRPEQELGDSRYTLQCTYDLVHRGMNSGVLQLRFRHGPGVYAGGTRIRLEELGSPTKWLDRVLPEHSPDVASSSRAPGAAGSCDEESR